MGSREADAAIRWTQGNMAKCIQFHCEVLRVRGDGPDVCRPVYEQARQLPDCTASLRQRIDERLQRLAQ